MDLGIRNKKALITGGRAARVITFLVSAAASFVIGTSVNIDGGVAAVL